MNKTSCWALLAALAIGPLAAQASPITDAQGDFLPTFGGSTSSGDLDVLSASVNYDPVHDTFILSSRVNGTPGATPGGFYVWGVNRGAGTAGFAANGISGVLFDRVILVRPDGTGTVNGAGNLAPGSVTIWNDTITAVVPVSLLPSTGFSKYDYQWNIWPRDGRVAGFAAISDFAPNNSDFAGAVLPLPSSLALSALGLAVLGWRQRRSAAPEAV